MYGAPAGKNEVPRPDWAVTDNLKYTPDLFKLIHIRPATGAIQLKNRCRDDGLMFNNARTTTISCAGVRFFNNPIIREKINEAQTGSLQKRFDVSVPHW